MNIAKRFGLTAEEPHPLELAVVNPLRGDNQEPKPHHPSPTAGRPTGITSESNQSSVPLATSKIARSSKNLLSTATRMTQQQAITSQQTLGLKLSEIIRFASAAAPDSISTAEFGRRWTDALCSF